MADALVVACGDATVPAGGEQAGEWAGGQVDVLALPALPGVEAVDPVLDALGDRRLVVTGTDADLAAVVLRLLRTERLGSVLVGFVPAGGPAAGGHEGVSAVAETFGLPASPWHAMRLALVGDPDPVPLIRDDAGGVLVGRGVLLRIRGVAYCDDERILRGGTARLEVSPDPEAGPDASVDGLVVRVWNPGLFRRVVTESRGRAVQIGCSPNQPICDGIEHDRLIRRWTWYRHTEDLRLIRGLI